MPDIFIAKEIKKTGEKERSESPKQKRVIEKLKPQRTSNPLASLVIFPQKVTFDTQDEEEKIVFFVRRHPITNLKWLLIVTIMVFISPFISILFSDILNSPHRRFILILGWYLLIFSYALIQFLKWFFTVGIVTDERIVDIDFPNLLYRDISSTKIDMIQDVSVKMGGFFRSLFNYGDVYIQTAGEQREFVFEAIPQPERVIKIINELKFEEEQEKIEGRVR